MIARMVKWVGIAGAPTPHSIWNGHGWRLVPGRHKFVELSELYHAGSGFIVLFHGR